MTSLYSSDLIIVQTLHDLALAGIVALDSTDATSEIRGYCLGVAPHLSSDYISEGERIALFAQGLTAPGSATRLLDLAEISGVCSYALAAHARSIDDDAKAVAALKAVQ